ncbi:hypothetical protein B0J11DRAFT_89923 [Dendryphion nanum]|uniref:Uncharacterized protein n=1 Tax=Dendryphion nanum TaxID=256645 RepID=A0A9P9IF68_9PLEO|nr:hypothetical protein B0J11DRAFT_89923 [Dendryphion nanum]
MMRPPPRMSWGCEGLLGLEWPGLVAGRWLHSIAPFGFGPADCRHCLWFGFCFGVEKVSPWIMNGVFKSGECTDLVGRVGSNVPPNCVRLPPSFNLVQYQFQ